MFAALPFRYILHHNLCEFKKKKSVQVQEQELTSTRSSLELTPEVTCWALRKMHPYNFFSSALELPEGPGRVAALCYRTALLLWENTGHV